MVNLSSVSNMKMNEFQENTSKNILAEGLLGALCSSSENTERAPVENAAISTSSLSGLTEMLKLGPIQIPPPPGTVSV